MKLSQKVLKVIISFLFAATWHSSLMAHSEPHKSRYVAEHGQDIGYCDTVEQPCRTIGYAVKKANKGDQVLVAAGQYHIASLDEVFFLKSEIVPILPGFSSKDSFHSQNVKQNPTWLNGIPAELADELRHKGFRVISDGKSNISPQELAKMLEAFSALNQKQADTACVSGLAGSFPCNKVDLVAHIPLSAMSSNPSSGNDVWGHVDLNTGTEYAIMGVRNGAVVFDLSDPSSPVEVGIVSGSSSTWRDIKVYQYFDTNSRLWRAYAYVTIDSASDGVTIMDLNNLPNSVSLVERNPSVGNAHNVYISNVDHTLNIKLDGAEPKLQLMGANRHAGSFHSYSLGEPDTISDESNQSSFGGYTHDGTSVLIDDSRKDTGCYNGGQNCAVFVDFNEKEMRLWDITLPQDTRQLGQVGYSDVSLANQYIHSGWVTDDKRYVLLHDEFDEYKGGLNSTVRIFLIDDLRNPVQVGQWTGATRAIDHNGFVRGNRYYMSNYERGLTVLDITDPTNPGEVGYFDTFPSSNNASFNGAWGVYPYLPSGLILLSDINSGLYVLRDNTRDHLQGQFHFENNEITVDRGTDTVITVQRQGNAADVSDASVFYEMISGSAEQSSDFTAVRGELVWNAGDTSDKTFTVSIAADPSATQPRESFFIRLYDPRNGANLTYPSYLKVKLNGVVQAGTLGFDSDSVQIAESAASLLVTVQRTGGAEGTASIDYATAEVSATADQDYQSQTGTLNWADGESENKTFIITLIDDSETESDEQFSIQLSNAQGAGLSEPQQLTVTLLDDESNTLPTVAVQDDFQVNTNQTVTLSATVTDQENDSISYSWQQQSGPGVSISSADQASASFNAPSTAGEVVIQLTATDARGGSSSDSVTITVVAPKSGSGGLYWGVLFCLIGAFRLRQGRRK